MPTLYQRRTLVKHLAMRRTLWIVCAEDLPLIQSAASDRVADNERRKLVADAQKAGITADGDAWLDTACTAVLRSPRRARADQRQGTARGATANWPGHHDPAPGKRWGGETPLAPRVLTVLSVRGDIVRGPNDGAWTISRPRWAPMSRLAARDAADAVAPEAARAELVRRWLGAFGPATVTDIKWWFGNTLTWARQALRDIDAVEVDLDGTPGFVLPDDLEVEPAAEPWCALLPGLDVTTMGWYDRDWYLGEHRGQVFDTQRQWRPDGLVERPDRRRLGSGRRRPGRTAVARRRRPRREARVDAAGRRADRVARRRAGQPALSVPADKSGRRRAELSADS